MIPSVAAVWAQMVLAENLLPCLAPTPVAHKMELCGTAVLLIPHDNKALQQNAFVATRVHSGGVGVDEGS